MWVQSSDRYATYRSSNAPADKISQKATDAHDLCSFQRAWNLAQRNVSSNQSDCDDVSSEQHGVVARARTGGKEFRLSRERKADLSHRRFVNGASNQGVDFAGIG